jgi:TPR repeat protein
VDKDGLKAVHWFTMAAEQGSPVGQANLGIMFRDGLIGVDRDECKAVGWMGKAAHQPDQASSFQNQVVEVLREWDTKLADVAKGWQIIYDPDPREPVGQV